MSRIKYRRKSDLNDQEARKYIKISSIEEGFSEEQFEIQTTTPEVISESNSASDGDISLENISVEEPLKKQSENQSITPEVIVESNSDSESDTLSIGEFSEEAFQPAVENLQKTRSYRQKKTSSESDQDNIRSHIKISSVEPEEISYPIINYDNPPSLPAVQSSTSSNTVGSWNVAFIAGEVAITATVAIATAYHIIGILDQVVPMANRPLIIVLNEADAKARLLPLLEVAVPSGAHKNKAMLHLRAYTLDEISNIPDAGVQGTGIGPATIEAIRPVINNFNDGILQDLNAQQLLDYQRDVTNAQNAVYTFTHKSAKVIQALDTAVDVVKIAYEPNVNNLKNVALDLNDLYSVYYGSNTYSASISAGHAAYLIYQGEYAQAAQQGITTAGSMLLAHIMNNHASAESYGLPAVLSLNIAVAINLYTSFKEYMGDTGNLRSIIAYKDLYQGLSNTPLNALYDFSSLAAKYDVDINNIKLNTEMENAKFFLDSKGEFGKKLYEYIYAPVIKEKYELLNKVAQKELTQEQASELMTKHLIIELEGRTYDHCIETSDDKSYHCYNEELQIVDHVVIGEDNTLIDVTTL